MKYSFYYRVTAVLKIYFLEMEKMVYIDVAKAADKVDF